MNETLARATKQRRILVFRYHGHLRTVEPHMYGIQSSSGKEIIYGWQIGGTSDSNDLPSWRSFYVDDIEELHTTLAPFAPQPYNPATPRLTDVYARA